MLVIGVDDNKGIHSAEIDDPDTDNPAKLHDELKKATGQSGGFDLILVVEGDELKHSFVEGDDFDASEVVDDDELDIDDLTDNDPNLDDDDDDEEDDNEE